MLCCVQDLHVTICLFCLADSVFNSSINNIKLENLHAGNGEFLLIKCLCGVLFFVFKKTFILGIDKSFCKSSNETTYSEEVLETTKGAMSGFTSKTVLCQSLITDWSPLSRNQKVLFWYSSSLQNVHGIIWYCNLSLCPSSYPVAVQMKTTKQNSYKMKYRHNHH